VQGVLCMLIIMFTVYILKSEKTGRYYIGHCEDMHERMKRHNGGYVRSTAPYRPWVVIYQELSQNRLRASQREKQIKSYKGGEAFRKLLYKAKEC